MKVIYLYRSKRQTQLEAVLQGCSPDTPLYGLNHLKEFGIEGFFWDADREPGLMTGMLQRCSRGVVRNSGIGWNIGQALRTVRRQGCVDCFFATTDSTGLPMALLKGLGILKKPLVVASQGLCSSLDRLGWNGSFRFHRWSMRAVDHFVVYGWAERFDLHERFGVPLAKITWIPFGVDGDYFKGFTEGPGDENGTILTVGRDRCRDLGLLMKVAARLPYTFKVITSPDRLFGINVPANVEVRFDLSMKELCREYLSCRFVALPVVESSYSFATTTVMDALNLSKAVVVSRTRAAGDEIGGYGFKDGEHCRFVPVGDIDALEAAICELWHDAELRSRIAAAGAEYVSRFSTKKLAEELALIFRSATRNH